MTPSDPLVHGKGQNPVEEKAREEAIDALNAAQNWSLESERSGKALAYRVAVRDGWNAAREFFVGRGYTPRSMLRAQAATQGLCPICGQEQPSGVHDKEER